MSQDEIVCFTDGSAIFNGAPSCKGSSALCWPNGEFQDKAYFLPKKSTRSCNRMEFFAAIRAMELADEYDPSKTKTLKIFTDSNLLIQTFVKWMDNWQARGWSKSSPGEIKNLDLVKRLFGFKQSRKIEFVHVRAHTGGKDYNSIWNDKVDKLAYSAVHLDDISQVVFEKSGDSEESGSSTKKRTKKSTKKSVYKKKKRKIG